MTAYDRYAPYIKEYIYKKGWNELRDVQVEACEAILDTDKDVIVASGTASGKTEAAFFPILTQLEKDPPSSVSVLYIGPLKALINDQFRRLSELLEDHELPVYPWHGDIPGNVKKKAREADSGIIQITPEALEALLLKHPEVIPKLFSDLRFVVIDEIHAMMGTDRGDQVICLLERIERMTGRRARRIGLSATLGDYGAAERFISSGNPDRVQSVGLDSAPRSIGINVETFPYPNIDEDVPRDDLNYLYDRMRKTKSLAFLNSRREAEELIAELKILAARRSEPDIFYVHHGSISAQLRREAEKALKDSNHPVAAAATLTLELGIDIGDLDQTIQIGAPFSCSSFVQRLGRSGRRTGKPLMRFLNYCAPKILSPKSVPWDLLRSIAIIELYTKERWIEPIEEKPKPFSLLIHQTLSILYAATELTPANLARAVLTLAPFKNSITQEEFREILRHLIERDYIQVLDEGTLIIGMIGERIINHYSFYAVFADSDEYKVLCAGTEIGSLSEAPLPGEKFSLAGDSWEVLDVDLDRKIVNVAPSESSKTPNWIGTGIDIHGRIFEKMRDVLASDEDYPYLLPGAKKALKRARRYAKKSGMLDGLVEDDDGTLYLFPWCSTEMTRTLTKVFQNALRAELRIKSVERNINYLAVSTELTTRQFANKLKGLRLVNLSVDDVLGNSLVPRVDKYDSLLPPDLLKESYINNKLDLEGTEKLLEEFLT